MESVYARTYQLELFYAAQGPPPCRLSKEDLIETRYIETPHRNGAEIQQERTLDLYSKNLIETPL
jgi:hypothetical protein